MQLSCCHTVHPHTGHESLHTVNLRVNNLTWLWLVVSKTMQSTGSLIVLYEVQTKNAIIFYCIGDNLNVYIRDDIKDLWHLTSLQGRFNFLSSVRIAWCRLLLSLQTTTCSFRVETLSIYSSCDINLCSDSVIWCKVTLGGDDNRANN